MVIRHTPSCKGLKTMTYDYYTCNRSFTKFLMIVNKQKKINTSSHSTDIPQLSKNTNPTVPSNYQKFPSE